MTEQSFPACLWGGKPEKLVADRGSEFIRGDLQALLEVEGVAPLEGPPEH